MTPDEVFVSGVRETLATTSQAKSSSPALSPFQSVLFPRSEISAYIDGQPAPEFFKDLNLDQVVAAIAESFKDYNLASFFYAPLNDLESITYRQGIMRDLESDRLIEILKSFSAKMRNLREHLKQANELYYKYAIERAFLGAVAIYYDAIESLSLDLANLDLESRGLRAFREYLASYVASSPFRRLMDEGADLLSDFSNIRYCLLLKDGSVTVRNYEGESDYSTTVEETFAKFSRDTSNAYRMKVPIPETMNHIQAEILNGVASLYPEVFSALDEFSARHSEYLDLTISRFDREIQFYIAYRSYMEKFRRAGLSFCLPHLSETSKEVQAREAFDIALADRLLRENVPVVCNDFFLRNPERIFVVSGPNQGGKTTFARMFAQLHYLGSLGCLVPGREAALFCCDRIFAYFDREEKITNLRGKLHDDLVRIHIILEQATTNSIIILNEIFSSTTLQDAVDLSKKIMGKIAELDVLGVWITFLDELASFNDKTVSMVSLVDAIDPAIRTFELERRTADGLAYSHAIAEKHRVTYRWLKERIRG